MIYVGADTQGSPVIEVQPEAIALDAAQLLGPSDALIHSASICLFWKLIIQLFGLFCPPNSHDIGHNAFLIPFDLVSHVAVVSGDLFLGTYKVMFHTWGLLVGQVGALELPSVIEKNAYAAIYRSKLQVTFNTGDSTGSWIKARYATLMHCMAQVLVNPTPNNVQLVGWLVVACVPRCLDLR